MNAKRKLGRGFSLVEVLAAVAIIGVVVFLAIPNIVQVKTDSEANLATARVEALNMGMASYVQAVGLTAAEAAWTGANNEARYDLIRAYLAFSDENLNGDGAFMPAGYEATLPVSLSPLTSASWAAAAVEEPE